MIITKIFKSGNSAAVRLPKELGLEPGTDVEIVKDENGIHLREAPRAIDISGFYGRCPDLKPIERLDFEPRELDWDGKRLRRG